MIKSCLDCKHCKSLSEHNWSKHDASKFCDSMNQVLYDFAYECAEDCSEYEPRKEKTNAE